MPKNKHNKSKRSKKNKRKEKPPRQLQTISPGSQSEEDNPPPENIPQPGTFKAHSPQPATPAAETPEPGSSDEGSPDLRPYEETEPRVPLIPGVGLPGRQRQEPEPQPGASGLSRRTLGRSRKKDKRTKSLEHTPESSPPKSEGGSSRSHSVGSSGNGASPETEKQSLFNEDMTYDDVTEVMYRRYRGEGYVRSAAMLRVTFETKRTIEDVMQLINARIPQAQEALEEKKKKEKEAKEKREEKEKKAKKEGRDKQ